MPVIEYGEMGVLVKPYPDDKMVIHWRVTKKAIAAADIPLEMIKKDDPIYYTSMGWIGGKVDKSDYFEPTERERSLRPCILRAYDYALKNWSQWRNETH
jgi:hypothetical protein